MIANSYTSIYQIVLDSGLDLDLDVYCSKPQVGVKPIASGRGQPAYSDLLWMGVCHWSLKKTYTQFFYGGGNKQNSGKIKISTYICRKIKQELSQLYFVSMNSSQEFTWSLTQLLLKGHWTSSTSSPNFFQNGSGKSWDFYTIRSVGMGNDCMQSFTF